MFLVLRLSAPCPSRGRCLGGVTSSGSETHSLETPACLPREGAPGVPVPTDPRSLCCRSGAAVPGPALQRQPPVPASGRQPSPHLEVATQPAGAGPDRPELQRAGPGAGHGRLHSGRGRWRGTGAALPQPHGDQDCPGDRQVSRAVPAVSFLPASTCRAKKRGSRGAHWGIWRSFHPGRCLVLGKGPPAQDSVPMCLGLGVTPVMSSRN